MGEYVFSVCVYPLSEIEAAALRERLQDIILAEVEARLAYMGPVVVEEVATEGTEATEENGGKDEQEKTLHS